MNSYKKKLLMSFSILIMLTIIYSCHHFYMVTKSKAVTNSQKASQIDSLKLDNRYFILHNGGESFWIRHIIIDSSKTIAQCVLDTVSDKHILYVSGGSKRDDYKAHDIYEKGIVTEVHLYIDDDTLIKYGKYILPLGKITKIEMIQKDKNRTTASYVLGGLGITAVSSLLILIVVFAATGPFF